MATISDEDILVAVDNFIAGREPGQVLSALYLRTPSVSGDDLDSVSNLVPIEQITVVHLVNKLKRSNIESTVILLATLRRLRTDDAWVHYNLCKCLSALVDAGVAEAQLPAIIHSLLAVDGLKDMPNGLPLPLGVLAREMGTFAPREAVRRGMLAMRLGHKMGLHLAARAFEVLGLEPLKTQPSITQALGLADALHFGADTVPQTTSLRNAVDLQSVIVERPRRSTFPAVRGDARHYIFAQERQEDDLPEIAVHRVTRGTFSIDATRPGLEQHYVFDSTDKCILDLANGIEPFIAETILQCEEPVAILDDMFSGVMNICHFLLDRVTRIPLYERAWSRPAKFLLVDDFPYYRDILDRIGLTDRIIIPPSKRVSIRAPEILFSSNIARDFRHPAHHCADWAVDYLRHILMIEDRPAQPGRKLLISRGDARGRTILNWEEVLPVFLRHGFEIIELSRLATEAQIELFRDASQVVGVHGAGLTNILFAPRDCAVLEILQPLVATGAYWLLASSLGQRYFALIADDAELPQPDYTTWVHNAANNLRDIVLPIDRLEAALASLSA